MRTKCFDDDGANIVLRGALGEKLDEDEIVVTIGDDAGEIVGLREYEAVRIVGGSYRSELTAECECGFDAGTEVSEVLRAGESWSARNEARGNHRFGRIERGAERDVTGIGEGDEGAGREIGMRGRFEIGAIDPEMAGAETVCGAAGDAEGEHIFSVRGWKSCNPTHDKGRHGWGTRLVRRSAEIMWDKARKIAGDGTGVFADAHAATLLVDHP